MVVAVRGREGDSREFKSVKDAASWLQPVKIDGYSDTIIISWTFRRAAKGAVVIPVLHAYFNGSSFTLLAKVCSAQLVSVSLKYLHFES